jgi:hypothetical protein
MAHDSWPLQDNTLNYVRKFTTPLGTTPQRHAPQFLAAVSQTACIVSCKRPISDDLRCCAAVSTVISQLQRFAKIHLPCLYSPRFTYFE